VTDAASPPPRPVALICADLLTGGPLVQAIRDAGFTPKRFLSVAKADPAGAAGTLLDLSMPGAVDWLESQPDDGPPALSFGPHVHVELLKNARAADRGPVLTRSQLAEGVPAWLETLR